MTQPVPPRPSLSPTESDNGNRSTTWKWLAALFLLSALVLSFSYHAHHEFRNSIAGTFNRQQIVILNSLQNLLHDHLVHLEQNLKHAVNMVSGSDAETGPAWSALDLMFQDHREDFTGIYLLDDDGAVLHSATEKASPPSRIDLGRDSPASAAENETFLTERFITTDLETQSFMVVPFALPGKSSKRYLLAGSMNIKNFIEGHLTAFAGTSDCFLLADYRGNIYSLQNIHHEKKSFMERGNIFSPANECFQCHEAGYFNDIRQAAGDNTVGNTVHTSPDGTLFNRTSLPFTLYRQTWVLSICTPYDSVQGMIDSNFLRGMLYSLLALLLIGSLSFLVLQAQRKKAFSDAEARNMSAIAASAEALRASEENYRSLVENINVGIYRSSIEGNGRFINANPAMASILGFDSVDALKEKAVAEFYEKPEERSAFIDEVIAKESVKKRELTLRRNNGETFTASCSATIRRNEAGDVLWVDGVIEDVTENKSLEDERLRIVKLESLGLLAGGIAHDFNNLLAAILGNIGVVKYQLEHKTATDEEIITVLREAEAANLRAAELTRQLLTFSKGGAPVTAPQSIGKIIRESSDFVLSGTSTKVKYDLAPDLLLAKIDGGQISQVIQNLVLNASQAMTGWGVVTIGAKNEVLSDHPTLKPGSYIRLVIEDNGGGIEAEHLPKIFDPYYSTKEEGHGLGLATVHSIVQKHGGDISVSSTVGRGTVFTIRLPAAGEIAGDRELATERIPRGEGEKILIIDDDRAVGQTLKKMLSSLGYNAVSVESGESGAELFADAKNGNRPFRLVVTDLTIAGGMGGVEIKDRIRKIDEEVKIIVSSGYSNDPVMADFRKFGFDDVLPKPYVVKSVAETVSRNL